jgi:hypothetical protein
MEMDIQMSLCRTIPNGEKIDYSHRKNRQLQLFFDKSCQISMKPFNCCKNRIGGKLVW